MSEIPRLDDFLDPLHHGIWEVTVPKDRVTEPLGTGWERSLINIPTPGTLASYRKGQYHVHETASAWKVHLDRYDPKLHPFLHLIDDAPLLLMIADTFAALVAGVRKGPDTKLGTMLKEQNRTWEILVLVGISLILAAAWVITNPLHTFGGIIHILFPGGILVSGVLIGRKGFSKEPRRIISPGSIFLGVSVFLLGIVTIFLPLDLFIQVLLLVLSLWAFGSALMAFSMVARGRDAVPEGFFRRIMLGILSFMLAVSILLVPDAMLALLMEVFGILIFLTGSVLVAGGLRLRVKMVEKPEA